MKRVSVILTFSFQHTKFINIKETEKPLEKKNLFTVLVFVNHLITVNSNDNNNNTKRSLFNSFNPFMLYTIQTDNKRYNKTHETTTNQTKKKT